MLSVAMVSRKGATSAAAVPDGVSESDVADKYLVWSRICKQTGLFNDALVNLMDLWTGGQMVWWTDRSADRWTDDERTRPLCSV